MNLFQALQDIQLFSNPGNIFSLLTEEEWLRIFEEMLIKINPVEELTWKMYYGIGYQKLSFGQIGKVLKPSVSGHIVKQYVTRTQRFLRHPIRANILYSALGMELKPMPPAEEIALYSKSECDSLSALGLSTKCLRTLECGNIRTIPELISRTEHELRHKVYGLGKKSLEIKEALLVHNLSFK